jgi:WD40 repeat protein
VLSAQFAQLAQFPMGFSRPGGSRDLHLRGTVLHPLFHDVLVSKPSALWLGTISALQPEAEEFVTHSSVVYLVAFSHDSVRLASASDDRTVKI